MFNLIDSIRENPVLFKQLAVGDQLITEYECPLARQKESLWTDRDYIVYVIEGKKIWHIPEASYELTPGKCIYVKKGAHIVEQFFDARFCLVVFFISDNFIQDTIRYHDELKNSGITSEPITPITFIQTDDSLHAFFNSVVPYFLNDRQANKTLLELKFKELILNIINIPGNKSITSYFQSLLTDSQSELIRKIMEENFLFNLKLEEYARMCGRSLSAFKRDFENHFKTTPGRWLLVRRLKHAHLLLQTSAKSISEVAFESGFENVSHFSRSFKQHYGESPVNFRSKTERTFQQHH